jgi:hypothetical protein
VHAILIVRRRIVLVLQLVFGFQPIPEGVSTVDTAVAAVNPARTPLNFVQSVRVLVFWTFLRVLMCRRVLTAGGVDGLVRYNHVWPSFFYE